MRSRLSAFALLYCAVALAVAPPAFGWGSDGHWIIAGIAERHLNAQAKANVAILLEGRTLRDVASWADEIRAKRDQPEYARYSSTLLGHFVSIPREADAYDAQRDCPRGDCVVAQIDHFSRVLGDAAVPNEARAEALRFLIHFIADVHQPLHCSDERDFGGNSIPIIFFGDETTVHRLWDTQLITHAGRDRKAYIDLLDERLRMRGFNSITNGTPATWATDSHRIARDLAYDMPTGPDASERYYDANLRPLEDQLIYAGARLAWRLNQLLGGEPIPVSTKVAKPPVIATNVAKGPVTATDVEKSPVAATKASPPPPAVEPSLGTRLESWYDAHHARPWFWIVTGTSSVLGTYLLGMVAILLLAWTRGSQFIARSRLRKAALAPLRIQPASARWALMIGYGRRLNRRPDVVRAAAAYFGLPAVVDDGRTILPDLTGERLHQTIAASVGPQKPLFVLGTGGAGKSTLLAHLAHLGVTGRLPGSLRGFVPVLVAAADYSGDFVRAIGAALSDRDGVDVGDERDAVIDLLQSGRFLILFDGLSEVFGDQQQALREVVQTTTGAALRSCRVLIATRQLAGDVREARTLELQPLTQPVVQELLVHYTLTEAARNRIRAQIESFAGGSIEPLLFTMMLEASSDGELARTRSKLYERYFRTQLKTRTNDEWLGWRDGLEMLAMRFVLPTGRRGYGMTRAQLIDFFSGKREGAPDVESTPARLKRMYHLDPGDALGVLKMLTSARILIGDRRIRFAHDTFEEFFLASGIISQLTENPDWSPPAWLQDVQRAPELQNVVRFIRELLDEEGREGFPEYVFKDCG